MSEIKYKQFERIALNWAGAISERDTAEMAKTAISDYVCENTKELLDKTAQSATDKFDAANSEFWSAVKSMCEPNDWRRVEDGLPEKTGDYLISEDGEVFTAFYFAVQKDWSSVDSNDQTDYHKPQGWMPLPAPFEG